MRAMMKLFRRNKKVENTRKHNPMVYVHCHWTDNRGRTAERMLKSVLEEHVANGNIFEDYEIIAYIER